MIVLIPYLTVRLSLLEINVSNVPSLFSTLLNIP